ncbi:MAG: ion transporter [gamma proteobacterium symbiont of Bathyaustriella thionipta]|nr:ion transporter [gamma proteobacterium symbiont of Bathyaustriella thionipta]MCU7949882.1 ion transporter [gamma proteobacterium symbiont of Bathyaustriella thionipta]MCU7952124.1 ion transporter [gamma proteobacterium symbiont of Bathyaustriella thionipta]MCU7956456.1 ion transporter [gamma proteobacterium symbiont of Bathyaustriella thionipta]MCU7968768.1 ion transporter [gamma proteobacterium symbiont of Bathyaustriella thionipta]
MQATNLQQKFDKLRSNKLFELFVISIIIFSALVIGAKTYDISPGTLWVVHLLDWFITFFFLTEIIIRFIGEKNKKEFFKHGWNIFDTLIVITSLIPVEDSELAIIGRLIRIFRVLRMVSIIPELKMLLNSLLIALPQLGYIVALMFIIFYIYAAIGSTFFAAINPLLWDDIAISMLTLFRVMTFEDWTDVMYETMSVYPLSWLYYLTFIFFTAFAFLNMVIGVVVNVLNEEHERIRREEEHVDEQVTLEELNNKIEELKQLIIQKRA